MTGANGAVAAEMADAVVQLISTLNEDQRRAAQWSFPSNEERLLWFYTPTDHGGLPLTDLTSAQHRLVHRLLATALSTPGYNTAALILGQENILDQVERFSVDFDRDRGRDPLLYWFSLFGEPGAKSWGWRFGGHHLSLHFTIADGKVVSSTPCFMGADPASVPLLGPHLHRPLGGVEDLGRELVRSLNQTQFDQALGSNVAPTDLVGANRSHLSDGDQSLPLPLIWRNRFEAEIDNRLAELQTREERALGVTEQVLRDLAYTTQPKGISARDLESDQQEILRQLLTTYVGRIHDDVADEQMSLVEDEFDQLHFLWAGGTEVGAPHYYRVQGKRLLAEYDNAQRSGNHVHTVWRDQLNDFGNDPLAQHYTTAEHHD